MPSLFILTWNPKKSDLKWPEDFQKMIAGHRRHRQWATGSRKSGIQEGDQVLLLRQITERGLVASGRATSEIFQEEHWGNPGHMGNYVGVRWDKALPPEDRLPTQELQKIFPKADWNPQGSGTQVPHEYASAVWEVWQSHLTSVEDARHAFPAEELDASDITIEGAKKRITVNRYERSAVARKRCLEIHGTSCTICGFDFEKRYGAIGEGFIHVHHLVDLSTIKKEYEVDGAKDLRPVCPNCHAMLHRKRPAMSIANLKRRLKK
jgi:5-methylcytosine-specific restriction enzyme A